MSRLCRQHSKREEIAIAREMGLEQVEAPAMQSHHRRLWWLEAMIDPHLR